MLAHDNDAAIKFLKAWHPTAPWALVAIKPGGGRILGASFSAEKETEARAWLDEQAKQEHNIYFHTNTVADHVSGKASRDDILQVTHLHVDIDPRAGEDLERERDRIRGLFETPPESVPPPTWVTFSGGGYQLFWELDEPIEIGGDVTKAEAAKRFNLQLEQLFKADNCHNIDRIMRLPGTINVPDAKKIAKGRTKQLATVVQHNESFVYPITTFTSAPEVQVDTGFASSIAVEIGGNIQRATSIDDIDAWAKENGGMLSDSLKILIVQGEDPDDPGKYDHDRSKALFAAVCGMERANLTPTQIFSVITDPDWKISASVLDKGSRVEKYAKRQIERAKERAISPELLTMNERHAVIASYGGRCVVIEEVYDDILGRSRLVKQSFEDLKKRYMNRRVSLGVDNKGKEKFAELGKWWLQNEHRRQYDYVTFAPGGCKPTAYNLWQGFACDPIPGDCSLFLEHTLKNICKNNRTYYDYLLGWMALAVQNPGAPGETAVILRGKRGTGKGIFIKTFGSLFGRHFLQVSDAKHIVGAFNQHLRDCIVLFADEAFFAGDKKHESTLKTLITEEIAIVEAKGVDAEAAPNYIHLLMASNSDWVVPAGIAERRFFVLDVGDDQMQSSSYFKPILDQMQKKGGREALLHMLMTYDTTKYDHRSIPDTAALTEQKQLSMSNEEEWWFNKLYCGELAVREASWSSRISCAWLYEDYVKFSETMGIHRKKSLAGLGRFLKKVTPTAYPRYKTEHTHGPQGDLEQRHVWEFPTLAKCREYWDEEFYKNEWPEVEEATLYTTGSDPF